MQTASQLAEWFSEFLESNLCNNNTELWVDADELRKLHAVRDRLAALSEPAGDADARWLRMVADYFGNPGEYSGLGLGAPSINRLRAIADRHDRLRERVKELEVAIASIEPLSVRTLATSERIHVIARADALLAARTALPPAAPQ